MIKIFIAASLLTLTIGFPHGLNENNKESGKCGYNSCPVPKEGFLNVHIVPHTHDDVGWLKTLDQYYYGSKTYIQNAGVQYIIDSVVNELHHDPKKKFIYVETAFFWKWLNEQEDYMKHRVKQLVKNGQLEFIGGAWSMNDEATTHYQSTIDQFTWGLRKLNDTFGACGRPKIGWQIDPFGHSREMASMMALFGFDGLFFGRLDYQDKRKRMESNTMEMIWEGNPSLGSQGDIFTGALFNLYMAPTGFCFDIMCGDEPIIEDKKSPDYNAYKKATYFLQQIDRQSLNYRTKNIMITMGGDFNYLDAHYYFKNLDKLMRHVNERQKTGSKVNVFYSTPSCYVKSLNEANITWPTKQDDFFPYASDPHAYWTGYFTSRPTLKYFERLGNKLLQVCKQLSTLAHLGPEENPDIDDLREAMGVMQHHDAITGTEKQHVAFDYARILDNAIDKCQIVTNAGLNKLASNSNPSLPPLSFKTCLLANISDCSISATANKFLVTVYNPISRPVDFFVRLPISDASYTVKNHKGVSLIQQIMPISRALHGMPGRAARTDLELIFKAEAVPALGYRTYTVVKGNKTSMKVLETSLDKDSEEIAIGSDSSFLTINTNTGLLSGLSFEGRKVRLDQTLEYYEGKPGTNAQFSDRASGAYIFRPQNNISLPINVNATTTLYTGPLVNEVHQVFSHWATQVVRQYSGNNYAEIEWLVGPIPIKDYKGKEVVSKYRTNIKNKGLFSTDSNGRQTLVRKRNFRPTWDVSIAEPVAGNYYPITTDISINDENLELTVLVDRAQGGSSINDGEIELMLHRRLLYDDGFGVGEALNEMAFETGLIARGQHWIIMGNVSNPNWPKQKRLLQQEKLLSPQILLTDVSSANYEQLASTYRFEYSGLAQALPPTVHILTLEPWKGKTYLLRLEHILDKTESSEVVTVNLSNLFAAFDIISIRETSLAADRWLDEVKRFKWRKESNEIFEAENTEETEETSLPTITLKPKEIRTFVCEIKPKSLI